MELSFRRALCPIRSPSVDTSSSSDGAAEAPLDQATEVEEYMRDDGDSDGDRWSGMLPEMLVEIVNRVQAGSEQWPLRKDVVSFAAVCRRWRDAAAAVVPSLTDSGVITFTSSLKQPGPRDLPMQCFIKRNKRTSMFYLYLSITPTFMDQGKFLLAAKRFRRGSHTEYVISLDADDLSQGSNAYMGKLRSDFLGRTFKIYDSCPPFSGARASNSRSGRRFAGKQISPQIPAGNFESGQVSYKFNIHKSRGPRRMLCTLQCHPAHENKQEGLLKAKDGCIVPQVVLKNKTPRWHEHLKCWCLNFHGRVTVASVKNFQLAATQDSYGDEDTILQFGKVGDDIFTMDYRQPLSAFQAFAICLTSFGTKLACE